MELCHNKTIHDNRKNLRWEEGGGVQSHESSPGSHDLGRLELMHIWANYDGTYLFSVVMV